MEKLLTLFLSSSGVSTDTRKIEKENLFFALKGDNFNGNLFASKALEMGAGYAIVDEDHGWNNDKIIRVENVLDSLQLLAHQYRLHLGIPVLAITGSNGKTTSKELIAAVLAKKFQLNYTKGNLNNEIGVPLTVLSTSLDHNFLITEMGANHKGEIAQLCEIASPDYGMITNIGKAHLEGFGGEEGVKIGKSELYKFLERTDGLVFLDTNDPTLVSLAPKINLIPYSSKDFTLVSNDPTIVVRHKDTGLVINTHLAGIYNLSNIVTAYYVGRYFGIDEVDISEAISGYLPNNNRSQLSKYKGVNIIKDAYNANPSSVQSSLNSFLNNNVDDKMVILGDMLELGEYTDIEHKSVLDFLKKKNISKAILVGPHYYKMKDQYPFDFYITTQDAKQFIDWQNLQLITVLIKGSRGIGLEKLLED
jgi:UDP-N-acetylmuramoyl-tripeptide--D-alanyl-D-alanine ligase